MTRIEQLQNIIRHAQAEIDRIHEQNKQAAHVRGLSQSPKWNAMTPEQRRYCEFMAFDPDNPVD